MFLALIWVQVPKLPFVTEPWEGANKEVWQKLWRLKIILMAAHFFCFTGFCIVSFPSSEEIMVATGRVFAIFSMLV